MATTFIEGQEIKGGVIRCIDQATGDIARTTGGWIEDEKYGWYAIIPATAASVEFDTAVTRTGTKTVKVSTTDATGRARTAVRLDPSASSDYNISDLKKYGIPLKASTVYRIICYAKTTNVASNSVYLNVRQASSVGARLASEIPSNKLTGNNDWTKLEVTFTSEATAAYLAVGALNNVAGNISDAWFDVNSMTLEEVSTINNPSASPALFYPKVTAVTSNDNIDQSQVVSDDTARLGEAASQKNAQQFTPTKKNLTGFVIRRGTDTGTYTGDITISIQADSGSTTPSGTDLGTPLVLTNAQWGAITANTDYTISYPLTLTIGATYWVVISSSTADNSNYTRVIVSSTNVYAGGVLKAFNGTVWGSAAAKDFYFKTLYSKNTTNFTVRTDTETLELSTNPEGWEDGLERDAYGINALKPLTLAPGDNTVYISSNGSSLADGEVDPSLQFRLSGRIKTGGSGSGRKDGGYARMGDKRIRSKRGTRYGALSQF